MGRRNNVAFIRRTGTPTRRESGARVWGYPLRTRDLIQARLRGIEEQIRSKSDRKQTLSLVKLEQLKERVRQIDVTMREDQQRIFDVYNRRGSSNDPDRAQNQSLEIGSIQLQMVRRGEEKRRLLEEIAKLNKELGMTEAEAK